VPKSIRKGEPWPKGIDVVEARSLRDALDRAMVKGE
jgi:hypothetical protein